MLADELVKIIDARANDLALTWYREVKTSHYTPNVALLSEEEALQIALGVYSRLSKWLTSTGDHEIEDTYNRFGERCHSRGFRMEEMVMLLILIKRHLWLHLLEQGIMTTNIEVYQALDVNNKVVLYFDRAIYFGLIGFKNARIQQREASSNA